MKKILAVLLAVMMIFSAMSVACIVYAEDTAPVEDVTVIDNGDDTGAADGDTATEYPSWLTELINRLIVVFTKLMTKLGIKLALKGII